ncbi:MAG: hypothetical protein R3Y62_02850 [Eubacteriales bacterium]
MTQKPRTSGGIHVGSATLVMLFSVICLTIFAVLAVITAGNGLTLAEKSAQAVTDYYDADYSAVQVFNQLQGNYQGTLVAPADYDAELTVVNGQPLLNYWVPMDDNQSIWVQVYEQDGTLAVSRWEVQQTGTWTAEETLDLWGGETIDLWDGGDTIGLWGG